MEMTRFPSYRGFSVRSILGFALAVIITALLWAILASPAAHAEDASWNGAAIQYNGAQYVSAGKITSSDGSGLPVDSPYYLYVEKYQAPGSSTAIDRARIIYFSPGVDPPKETVAKSVYFNYDATSKTYSNPYEQKDITLTTQASSANGSGASGSSCAVEGIGWIVCPVMNFLAGGMDFIFSAISQYMKVQPLETGNMQSSLYSAWGIMRNIANVAFIIAFIVIIYAQITSYKTNEFGFKRLLPRLIIAAVAINLSYIICAIAVDLSNVLGYSLQDVFYTMRDQILSSGSTDNTAQILSWQSITAFVLSGGTAALAAGVSIGAALIATGGTVTAAVFLLLPALVGLLVAILVVLLILAARQALIVILVIIAPVAIVLYLLPNTEKWFKKWRDLFMTLLIFFPAFSVVFGGSQLAGAVIIKNATSINMVILGMIVQVAPLVITPLLLKLSGSLLGGIARLVNDPNKGLIDRTRKWSGEHAERHRKRGVGATKWNGNPGELKKRNALRQSARYLDQRKRRRADLAANSETATQTAYENSKRYSRPANSKGRGGYDMAVQKAAFEADKGATHDAHAAHVEHAKRTQSSYMYGRALNVQAGKENLEAEQNLTTDHFNRHRIVGGTALNQSMMKLEESKLRLETSDSKKNTYVLDEKQRVGSTLHGLVDAHESSKLKLEGSQSRYTAMVDTMKRDASKELHLAAINAQSGKDQVEFAQQKLQAMFDTQRTTEGTTLNIDMKNLESAKGMAEGARAQVAQYIATQKSTIGTELHTVFTQTEEFKRGQQTAEAKFTRIIEEYNAGGRRVVEDGVEHVYIDGKDVTGTQQHVLADAMRDESARLAAETQGASSAKYVQQEYVSTMMNESSTTNAAFTDELLTAAAGIDKNGKTRAQANASTQLGKLQSENLSNNVTLLGDMAENSGTTIKKLAKELFASQIGEDANGNPVPQVDQDPSLLEAALEALAQDGDIPTMRKARMRDDKIDQSMMTRLFARNAGTMKAKGGFDLQNDPSLAGASEERMNASIAANLGSTSAANYPDMKNGEIISTQENIMQIMAAADSATDPKVRDAAQEGLKKSYVQISKALTDPRIRERLGDNLIPAIEIHKALDARFSHNPEYHVTYDKIDPRVL